MLIRVFYCGDQDHTPGLVDRARMTAVYASYSENPCVFERFETIEAMMPALQESIESQDVCAVYVSPALYLEMKMKVFEYLEMSTSISVDILDLLPESFPASRKEQYSLFPPSTVMFPSEDGINTAFCTATGRGNFILIPVYEGSVSVTQTKIADWFARKTVLAPSPDEPQVKLCKDAAGILFRRHLAVGVANSPTAEYIRVPARAGGEKYAACFKFVDTRPAPSDLTPRELTAKLAADAAWEENSELGCAMSNIYRVQKEGAVQHLVYVSVVCGGETAVSRVTSAGEEMSAFLKRAAKELFALIICAVTDRPIKSDNTDFDVF